MCKFMFITCLLVAWSTCSGQLFRQTIYGHRAPSAPQPLILRPPPQMFPPPQMLRAPRPLPVPPPPLPPRRMYPLYNGYSPVRNIDIYPNDFNRIYANGMAAVADDSWIADAIDGYNVVVVDNGTTPMPESTTSEQPESTTAGQKYPKFYYDNYEDLIDVKPADAIVIALLNLVAVIMIFMGSGISWVGRRSIASSDDRSDADMHGLTLLNDGLFAGSNATTGDQCLQRAACEVPQKAELYAQGLDALIVMKSVVTFIPDTQDHLTEIVDELRRVASMANDSIDCKLDFPCQYLDGG